MWALIYSDQTCIIPQEMLRGERLKFQAMWCRLGEQDFFMRTIETGRGEKGSLRSVDQS